MDVGDMAVDSDNKTFLCQRNATCGSDTFVDLVLSETGECFNIQMELIAPDTLHTYNEGHNNRHLNRLR